MVDYLDFRPVGDIEKDVKNYFLMHSRQDTYQHTLDVIKELIEMKKEFGRIEEESIAACYFHDLGRVVKNDEILNFCDVNNIYVTDEEIQLPSILHQKISCFIANKVFGIYEEKILHGIRYHTTLRKNPSMVEIEVYLADKMSWKEEEYRELALKVKEAVKESKEYATYVYLHDLHNKREDLKVYHKDSREAFDFFKHTYN